LKLKIRGVLYTAQPGDDQALLRVADVDVKNAHMTASPVDNLPLKLSQPAAKHAALTRDSRKGDKPPAPVTTSLP